MSTFNDIVDGITAELAIKAPCLYATTGNITLSGLTTQDNGDWASALTEDDRILVKNQSDASENGIYKAKSTAWQRSADWNGPRDITKGTLVRIVSGSTLSGSYWAVATSGTITIGTTEVTFTRDNNVLGTGALDDNIVTTDSLSAEVLALLSTNSAHQGAWQTSTAYTLGQTVTYEGILYMATETHTSGTFATDLAADKWVRISAPAATVGSDIASASELPVNEVGMFHDVTGTTNITSFATLDTGISKLKVLQFAGVLTITHANTTLELPGDTDITTAAGDVLTFYEYSAGDWRMIASSRGIMYGQPVRENIDFNDKTLSKVNIKDYELTKATPSSSGGALTVNLESGNFQAITLSEDTTITFSNWPAGVGEITLEVTQDSTGSRALTFSQTVKWPGGYAPTITSTGGAVDIITFYSPNGGTTIYGFSAGQDMRTGSSFTGDTGIVEKNYTNGGSFKTDGGLIVNFGKTSVGPNTGVAVTFDTEFTTAIITAVSGENNINPDPNDLSGAGIDDLSLAGGRVFNEAQVTRTISWLVIGT